MTAAMAHIDTARVESASGKVEGLQRESHRSGGLEKAGQKLLPTFSAPGAIESATAYTRRKKRQELDMAYPFASRSPPGLQIT